MSWRSEFADDFRCDDLGPAINGLIDESWHNDAAPHFHHSDDPNRTFWLWAQHPDPALREVSPGYRYLITCYAENEACLRTNDADWALHRLALLVHGGTCPKHGRPHPLV